MSLFHNFITPQSGGVLVSRLTFLICSHLMDVVDVNFVKAFHSSVHSTLYSSTVIIIRFPFHFYLVLRSHTFFSALTVQR